MKNYTHTFIAHESQLEMIAISLLGDRPTVGALYPQHHSHDGARPARGGYKKELDKYKKYKSDVCQVIQLFFSTESGVAGGSRCGRGGRGVGVKSRTRTGGGIARTRGRADRCHSRADPGH